ncbi:MAG: stage 0 sporulation family protein [Clostridia bacterium]|nr:stage 0 sporulation family protein [Clostridia bacterium]
MVKVVGVRFKENGKSYYFNPKNLNIKLGDHVIVETVRGLEYGEVTLVDKEVDEETFANPLKDVIRIATKEDAKKNEENEAKEKDALKICEEKIAKHELDMKLIDVEYTFDNSKIIFYFSAEGRIDFRELVKDLASVFRTRIELRQIGVRDEAKLLGGLGHCGREFCCHGFLCDFQPVSIKMAKDQCLSLNPGKISGACGRLMCCLAYEQAGYEDKLKRVPKVGSFVATPDGEGTVVASNILKERVSVKLSGQDDNVDLIEYNASDVNVIEEAKETTTNDDIEELKKLED